MSRSADVTPLRQARRTPIQPLTADRLEAVAGLYEQVMRSGRTEAPAGLVDTFRRMFLEPPNHHPDNPSLVFEGRDGGIIGFLGVYNREVYFDGRSILMACSGQFVVRPDAREMAPGAFLLKQFLDGPQALSITDGATEPVSRVWQRLHGRIALAASLGWRRWLRPLGGASEVLRRARPQWGPLLAAGSPLRSLGDRALRRVFEGRLPAPPPASGWTEEPLTAVAMAEAWPAMVRGYRLHADYSPAYAGWLLREMAAVRQHGDFTARLLRSDDGRVRGWYAYYLSRTGRAEVMQIAATPGAAGAVVGHLLHDADRRGAVVVDGRVDGRLIEALWRHRARITYPAATFALVHARDRALLDAIHAGEGFLTRADGEWWTGFLEDFEE